MLQQQRQQHHRLLENLLSSSSSIVFSTRSLSATKSSQTSCYNNSEVCTTKSSSSSASLINTTIRSIKTKAVAAMNYLTTTPPSSTATTTNTNTNNNNNNDSSIILKLSMLPNAIQNRLSIIMQRYNEIYNNNDSNDEGISTSSSVSGTKGKELSYLHQMKKYNDEMITFEEEYNGIYELYNDDNNNDIDLRNECYNELTSIKQKHYYIQQTIIDAILEQYVNSQDDNNDANDDNEDINDCIIEIRAGIGGDEATLFTNELLQCYITTVKNVLSSYFKLELLHISENELGGIREATISITSSSNNQYYPFCNNTNNIVYDSNNNNDDDDMIALSSTDTTNSHNNDNDNNNTPTILLGPYGIFRYESGVHRVQRIPINDVKLQTSACSVAVLSQNKQSNSKDVIPPSELRIETMRASGAGGQHINTTDSAVRITHIPTGITASIQDERSQHKNKEKALKLINIRVHDHKQQQSNAANNAIRHTLLGSGDRSERIRTYNYQNDRITDHRCKVTYNNISSLMKTGVDNNMVLLYLPHLKSLHRNELLQLIEDEDDNDNAKNNKNHNNKNNNPSKQHHNNNKKKI